MLQVFSLYKELTVQQNLALHARLYGLEPAKARARIAELVAAFALGAHLDTTAASLPLGIRQRLPLTVAVINELQVLLLDEPTSGVDPFARDQFWALLGDLSRRQGTPAEVMRQLGGPALEDALIAGLVQDHGERVGSGHSHKAGPSCIASPPTHVAVAVGRWMV